MIEHIFPIKPMHIDKCKNSEYMFGDTLLATSFKDGIHQFFHTIQDVRPYKIKYPQVLLHRQNFLGSDLANLSSQLFNHKFQYYYFKFL